ncbi:MAG: hypothetical protein IJ523_01440 [Succinivibrionaceae bacterium]|nr:hypothetical protein [Succinivibrionaceae bacterium]
MNASGFANGCDETWQQRNEYRQLLEEVSGANLRSAKEVSAYIVRNHLEQKYGNISGVLDMRRGADSWKYKGGISPRYYARLCSDLGFRHGKSDCYVTGYRSFRDLNR